MGNVERMFSVVGIRNITVTVKTVHVSHRENRMQVEKRWTTQVVSFFLFYNNFLIPISITKLSNVL